MRDDAENIQAHLRAASDAILLLLTEVGQLERHKRAIPPGEARFYIPATNSPTRPRRKVISRLAR